VTSLFGEDLPEGFIYQPDFISPDEERELVSAVERIQFAAFEMRGVVARRRVAFFGATYDRSLASTPVIPEFLQPIRARAAAWVGVDQAAFAMALVNEYPPGAPIGWHRDAPQYGIVVGLSLLSACRMMLRPYVSPGSRLSSTARRVATHVVALEPRSAYILSGAARSDHEHHIPAVRELRYSITFRTLRASG
jgi:alkylated DNA repair dioxygenase AlkB